MGFVGLAALVIAVAVIVAVPALGSNRDSARAASASRRITTASLPAMHRHMVSMLNRQKLHFHWVVCVRTDNRFHGVSVVRCNVDFGDPHIEAYCAVLRGGQLLSNFDHPAIPCRADSAGNTQTIIHYS